MNIEGRCYALCKNPSQKSCFTKDQVHCIQDIIINRIGAIKSMVNEIVDTGKADKAILSDALKGLSELEVWCRKIGQ